ncbi:extensin [Paenibacillus tyrfis]|nr:extensin [Paenibacillus tyrfis]
MPTGTGKTRLAEIAIQKCIERGFKAIYVTPLRALADEKYQEWRSKFQNKKVGVFSGDTIKVSKGTYKDSDVLIMTPERLDACLRNWRSHWSWIPEIDLLIIDEIHLLNDSNRGPRLEGTITRFIRLNPFTKIIGLSATMPNVEELSNWLDGVHYSTSWRKIPVTKSVIRYSNPVEKLNLLLNEVKETVTNKGKVLIFANSRSRTQFLSEELKNSGIDAAHHHAGLASEERKKIEFNFRNGATNVLVATSTLEMGLNLPARKVIIFDSIVFTERGFSELPVWSFMQRSGRAGRPGLDTEGEVVLMVPKWVKDVNKYLNDECEPIKSSMNNSKAIAEQILIEVSAGYSKTLEHVVKGFIPLTLYHLQHPENNINKTINSLFLSDMISINHEEKHNDSPILKATNLGRLAVKLMFSPETIIVINRFFQEIKDPNFFDLLLVATMTDECSPILQANYEELDYLMDFLSQTPSILMNYNLEDIRRIFGDRTMPRILAAVKMSSILHQLVNNISKAKLVDVYDLYEYDIELLKESTVRILDGMSAVFQSVSKKENNTEEKDIPVICRKTSLLSTMIHYELDSTTVTLTEINGVGGKTAKVLSAHGVNSINEAAQQSPAFMGKIKGIGIKLAKRIVESAKEIINSKDVFYFTEKPLDKKIVDKDYQQLDLCPYRLRRSLELKVSGLDNNIFRITGGREEHRVKRKAGDLICDCIDYERHQNDCKHILAVKRILLDKSVIKASKIMKTNTDDSIRSILPNIWFNNCRND